jgi:hypothetical protein
MKTAINQLKKIILPLIAKHTSVNIVTAPDLYWEQMAINLIKYETNYQPIIDTLTQLELDNSSYVFNQLPRIYLDFMNQVVAELAEDYVTGSRNELISILVNSNNEAFLKQVQFLESMQQAIISVERKRIKADLPDSYNRLAFEISEKEMANVIKKNSRADLKEKIKHWDEEMGKQDESVSIITEKVSNKKSKVISLSWMKYAVAASIIIAAGLFYFKNTDPGIVPVENRVVTTPDKKNDKNDIQKPEMSPPLIPAASLRATVFTSNRTVIVLESSSSLGFASNNKKEKILVFFKDVPSYILGYEKFFENLKSEKSLTKYNLELYKKELITLKEENGKYEFEKGELFLYEKDTKNYKVLLSEGHQYYLKKGETYYTLKVTETPLPLGKVTDAAAIESLEKISFENE